ncbi:MAG: PIG-L deacetylase family protein [Candidatus Korobacteraceae bacterium]|jgi:4-oxalomesaconate hydratase
MNTEAKSLIVVSAHAADFVWRAGGAIAVHTKLGYRAVVVCLTAGERGESNEVYAAEPGIAPAAVRARRKAEAVKAAQVLGAEVRFLDQQDYPFKPGPEVLESLVDIYREVQPQFILTHPRVDPANWDHVTTFRLALEARMVAQAPGRPGGKHIAAPQVYCFEPHQSELGEFKPDTLLDISEVWDLKWKAMQLVPSQTRMWNYYKNVAEQRGEVARRRTERKITHAEAYQKIFPTTVRQL